MQKHLFMPRMLVLALLLSSPALADIVAKSEYEAAEPIVIKVEATGVPETALLRGSLQVSDATVLQPISTESTFYCWAAPGKHLITAKGIWVVTDTGKLGGALQDFGMYEYTKTITVGSEVPPVPPPLPGTRWSVIWEEREDRTPQQGNLFLSIRKQYQNGQVQIHDVTNLPPSLRALESQRPPSLALPVQMILVRQTDGTDKVVRTVPLPSDVAGFAKELTQ